MPKFDWRPQGSPSYKREAPRDPRLHRPQGTTVTQFTGREIMAMIRAIHSLPQDQRSLQAQEAAIRCQFPTWAEARVSYALRALATVLGAMENGGFSAADKLSLLHTLRLVRVVRDESGRERITCDR